MQDAPFNHHGFLQQLAEGHLAAARCRACDALLLPPRSLCPNCYSSEMEWLPLSGRGSLLGYTFIYIGLPAMTAAGYDRLHPYCSGVVRLEEGPAISALIIPAHIGGSAPAGATAASTGLRVGLPVRAVFGLPTGLAFEPSISLFDRDQERGS